MKIEVTEGDPGRYEIEVYGIIPPKNAIKIHEVVRSMKYWESIQIAPSWGDCEAQCIFHSDKDTPPQELLDLFEESKYKYAVTDSVALEMIERSLYCNRWLGIPYREPDGREASLSSSGL